MFSFTLDIDEMDDPMDPDMSGWRSPETSDDDSMEIDDEIDEDSEETNQGHDEQVGDGFDPDKQKVLAVVKNNDSEEGAYIEFDFNHLGSKFLFLT